MFIFKDTRITTIKYRPTMQAYAHHERCSIRVTVWTLSADGCLGRQRPHQVLLFYI